MHACVHVCLCKSVCAHNYACVFVHVCACLVMWLIIALGVPCIVLQLSNLLEFLSYSKLKAYKLVTQHLLGWVGSYLNYNVYEKG